MIVIIPCWRRPAFLAATLRTIQNARGYKDHVFLFSVDRDFAPEILEVIEEFTATDYAVVAGGKPEHVHGPAWNILRAWKDAWLSAAGDPWIGLIEEDTLVSEAIFEFWDDALKLDQFAVGVSACRNQNVVGGDPPWHDLTWMSMVYRHASYQSLAVALRPRFVAEVIKHACPDYFRDPFDYCYQRLKDDGLPAHAVSQDALFHRVLRRNGDHLLYPLQPRAFHAGWYGYNRREGVELDPKNWRADCERILAMSADQMNEMADQRFRDIERCDLIMPRAELWLI